MPVQTQMQVRRGTASSWTSTNPTLAAGELGFETDTGKFKIGTGSSTWTGLAYATGLNAITYLYNATAAQTTFSGADANGLTLAYTVGTEQVFLNGALQVRGSDYTATNGTSIVLTSGALAGDVLNVIAYSPMSVSDTYTQAQANALFIPDAIVDAKGDIIAATAADTVARLAVGTNGQVLTVDSSTATGLSYKFAGLTHIQTTTFTAAATLNISSVFTSTYDNYRVVCSLKGSTADATVTLRMLTGTTTQDSGASYFASYTETNASGSTSVGSSNGATSAGLGTLETSSGNYFGMTLDFIGANLAVATNAVFQASILSGAGAFSNRTGVFAVNTGTQYTGFALLASTGNLEGGTVRVYGYNNG